jgi:hypothetical protein
MSAIPADQRDAHLGTIEKLFRAVERIEELPKGYTFFLPNESDVLLEAAKFIALERLCCPFFSFHLNVEGDRSTLSLSLTGQEGVKPFILAEIGHYLPLNIERKMDCR